jgi:hypothetical protein
MLFLLVLSLVNGSWLEFTKKTYGLLLWENAWWVFVEEFGQLILVCSHKNYYIILYYIILYSIVFLYIINCGHIYNMYIGICENLVIH